MYKEEVYLNVANFKECVTDSTSSKNKYEAFF